MYPEVRKRAQAELDEVVGPDRLPLLSDRPRLPYIDAIVQESLRWHPVAPLGDYCHVIATVCVAQPSQFQQASLTDLLKMTPTMDTSFLRVPSFRLMSGE
jgi:Cytochrome P450